jgi:membrane protease YdiL (CAAX protease family)
MSNAFVGAVTTPTDIPPVLMIVGLVWLALAVPVAIACGVFRRRSIVGPERIGNEESGWTLVSIFFFGLCAALFLGSALSLFLKSRQLDATLSQIVANLALEAAGFLVLVFLSAKVRPQGIDRLGLVMRRLPRGVTLGCAAVFVLYPMVMTASAITESLLHWAGWPDPKPNEILQLVDNSHQGVVVAVGILMAIIVAPFSEELVFRGFFQTMLSNLFAWIVRPKDQQPQMVLPVSDGDRILSYATPPLRQQSPIPAAARWVAVLITAGCFAYVHKELAFMPPLFVLALGLGYLYERTGNLWASIVAHSVFNGLQLLISMKYGTP